MKLLVLNLRGLQAGAIGPYGNRWTETFSLDTLAVQGVVFDQHLSVHPCPTQTRRAWRSGCQQFHDAGPDLLDVLHHQDVTTRLIVDTSRGEFADFAHGWRHVVKADDTASALKQARPHLKEPAPQWLLWLDLASLLPPWDVPDDVVEGYFSQAPPEDDEEEEVEVDLEPLEPIFAPQPGPIDVEDDDLYLSIRQTYAAAVSHLDRQLAVFLDGLADDVHVLVTADAGLPLGEHGMVGHVQPSLHQEVVHVPLILYGPGCPQGRRIAALTASLDLAATIAELAGTQMEGTHGVSLVPYLRDGAKPTRDHLALRAQVGDASAVGLRTAEWALLLPPTPDQPSRLYVKPDDRWEVNDVSLQQVELVERLEQTLYDTIQPQARKD